MDTLFEPTELTAILRALPDDSNDAVVALHKKVGERLSELGVEPGATKLRLAHADQLYAGCVLVLSYVKRHTEMDFRYDDSATTMSNWARLSALVADLAKSASERRRKQNREEIRLGIEDLIDASAQVKEKERFGFAVLNEGDRTRIFSALEKLRVIVEESSLSKKKKDALLAKLSDLHKEAAREFTGTERFFGFLGELSFVVGQMAKNAKPAIDEAKEMARIVMNRRSEQEGVELPAPEDFPQLPAPKDVKSEDKK